MNLHIRLATKNDAELIADISRQSFYDTFAPDNTKENMDVFLNEQFTKGKLMLEVGTPENIFLLAYAGEDVAGYAKLREGRTPEQLKRFRTLEIARFYALKSMIGKGVGKSLMQASLEIARENNKEMVWLGVWEKKSKGH